MLRHPPAPHRPGGGRPHGSDRDRGRVTFHPGLPALRPEPVPAGWFRGFRPHGIRVVWSLPLVPAGCVRHARKAGCGEGCSLRRVEVSWSVGQPSGPKVACLFLSAPGRCQKIEVELDIADHPEVLDLLTVHQRAAVAGRHQDDVLAIVHRADTRGRGCFVEGGHAALRHDERQSAAACGTGSDEVCSAVQGTAIGDAVQGCAAVRGGVVSHGSVWKEC